MRFDSLCMLIILDFFRCFSSFFLSATLLGTIGGALSLAIEALFPCFGGMRLLTLSLIFSKGFDPGCAFSSSRRFEGARGATGALVAFAEFAG